MSKNQDYSLSNKHFSAPAGNEVCAYCLDHQDEMVVVAMALFSWGVQSGPWARWKPHCGGINTREPSCVFEDESYMIWWRFYEEKSGELWRGRLDGEDGSRGIEDGEKPEEMQGLGWQEESITHVSLRFWRLAQSEVVLIWETFQERKNV